jgi:hypothetical protein
MRTLVTLVFVGAVIMALQAASAQQSTDNMPAVPGAVASIAGGIGATGSSAYQTTRFAVGRVCSRAVGPVVNGMSNRNTTELAAMQPAIRRTSSHRRARVRVIERRLAQADSLAAVSLAEGRPIAAVRYAMEGRSLLDAVKHHLVEERLR